MRTQSASQQDRTASLIRPASPWRIEALAVLPGHRLHVRFQDGLEGDVDMAGLTRSEHAGVFAALADPDRFAEARIEHGAVTWPGEIDLAPDAMYQAIKTAGIWVLS